MQEFRRSLPAYKEREALLNAISQNQVLYAFSFVLVGLGCLHYIYFYFCTNTWLQRSYKKALFIKVLEVNVG